LYLLGKREEYWQVEQSWGAINMYLNFYNKEIAYSLVGLLDSGDQWKTATNEIPERIPDQLIRQGIIRIVGNNRGTCPYPHFLSQPENPGNPSSDAKIPNSIAHFSRNRFCSSVSIHQPDLPAVKIDT
jgi:hypothetical protein